MNDLDPRWLRSFVAIASAGSMTRAASHVHRTQSAVSTHVQQLEASVGVQLIQRTTRTLALTEAGERFLPHARRLLELQDEACASLRPALATEIRRIGLSEYFLPARLGEILGVLRDAAPNARLEMEWASSAELARRFAAKELDLVVVATDAPKPGARLVRREPLAWVTAPGYAPPVTGSTPLVLLGPECPVRTLALAAVARAGRAHHLQLTCSGGHGAVAAIRAGWGVGCLNTAAIPPDLSVLSRKDSRGWPSPGRLSFYALSRPVMQATERSLRRWAAD